MLTPTFQGSTSSPRTASRHSYSRASALPVLRIICHEATHDECGDRSICETNLLRNHPRGQEVSPKYPSLHPIFLRSRSHQHRSHYLTIHLEFLFGDAWTENLSLSAVNMALPRPRGEDIPIAKYFQVYLLCAII